MNFYLIKDSISLLFVEEKHLYAVNDDADLLLCDPRDVFSPLDSAGEQLFRDTVVEGNYVKF